MSKSPATPLSIPGMPKKGEATPAVPSFEKVAPAPSPARSALQPSSATPRLLSRVQATIAVTVRLDEMRYERMKTWGTARRVTNQEVIVAALDRFFRLSDTEREQAITGVRR